ncbi:ParB-like protein [Sphingomonas sp.]|uniref:ParB-like protein n=1 Tax=Sphingomonas sp. TaxID=28214 RepID=UPI0025EAC7C6|nr:ParB-like protein [Sphingomonas sp.]
MRNSREPILTPVPIASLRPTQITVGLREVERKRLQWRGEGEHGGAYLGRHMIPVVLGPKRRPYVIDHHHLARALHDEGQSEVLTTVVADLHQLSLPAFWIFLDNRGWLHPFDTDGKRRDYSAIPKRIAKLVDDPFRSLAGAVREAGGYAKDVTPFSEFIWADYFRRRLKRPQLEAHYERAVAKALLLARAHEASFMPGWCGPDHVTSSL